MPDRPAHILLTVHGTMPAGESWTCGLRSMEIEFINGPGPEFGTLATSVATAWRKAFVALQMFIGSASNAPTVDGVTARALNQQGVTIGLAEGVPTGTSPAPSGTAPHPNQCAVALSLVTARAGRTGKGRIYLPLLAVGIAAGRINPSNFAAIGAGCATLFNDINTALNVYFPSLRLAVQSAKAFADDGSSYHGAPVTAVRFGDVVDTQRRRRAQLVETYTQNSLA